MKGNFKFVKKKLVKFFILDFISFIVKMYNILFILILISYYLLRYFTKKIIIQCDHDIRYH